MQWLDHLELDPAATQLPIQQTPQQGPKKCSASHSPIAWRLVHYYYFHTHCDTLASASSTQRTHTDKIHCQLLFATSPRLRAQSYTRLFETRQFSSCRAPLLL